MPPGLTVTGANTLPKIYKEFGSKKLVFDIARMTPKIQDIVKEKVAEIKAEGSLYERVLMNVDETHGDYIDRASTNDPELVRRFDETSTQHAARVFKPRGLDSGVYAFKVLNALSVIFEQPELKWEEIENVPLHELRILIFNILNFCDCPLVTDFNPKRIVNAEQLR